MTTRLAGYAAAAALTLATPAFAQDILIGIPTAQSSVVGVADHADWLNGAQMAIDDINAEGGVNGRMLRAEVVDIDLLSPEGTVGAFQALNARGVSAIASAFVIIPQPAMDAAAASGVPYMHGNTSLSSVELVAQNPERYRNIFMIDPDETWYGYGFIRYLDQLEASGQWSPANHRIHIVQEQIAYTQVISQAAQRAIAESDGRWELAEVTDIQFPVQDWTPVINALKDEGAGVIFVSHWIAAELAAFAQQFAYDPTPDSLVYLQYGPSQPEFLDLARGAGEGMIWGTVLGTPRTEEGMAFRDAYMALHGENMGEVYPASGYDTIQMLAEVWRTTDPADFDAVGQAIRHLSYQGLAGTYTFDRDQQRPLNYPWETDVMAEGIPHLIYQVQDNHHTIILPAELAEAEYQTPHWAE
ncbi:ABC transporter substrate-binding protein [Pararhodobacter zhoushanensis]|uniref:ABC transporter substrate-binding protein n=1 Tax=Pararhodobacter zhoushanensis TaxID=2479545 RepID=UPI0013DE7D74|nr:ABC transporter substrate-binding protein [Pararhodobacter zhoushanensis]